MPVSELNALLTGAVLAPLDDRAFLRVTGEDRTRWLNGMVTNSAQALAEGEGNYNFLLNAQGRIQGDCTVWRDGAEFLLETTKRQAAPIQQHLDRFIIMDDVELLPVMTENAEAKQVSSENDQHGLLLAGPLAAERLAAILLPAPAANHLAHAAYGGQPVLIFAPQAAVRSFEVWSAPETIAAIRATLEASGVEPIEPKTLEAFRIFAGMPRFGQDIRDRDLPQETEQSHALHFAKGCYLGQEIVERIRSRGQVHRGFTAFALTGELPLLPAPLTLDGKPAGELTSVAVVELETGLVTLALGYARRETHGRRLTYDGGTALKRNPLTADPLQAQD